MSETGKPILVIGSINMDLVAKTPRIPSAGETLIGTDFVTTPGGKGANQAVAAARLGASVSILGMVGRDVFGKTLEENLSAATVNTYAIEHADGPSGIASIAVARDGQNSIIVVPGANGRVDIDYLDRHAGLISAAGIVLCQLELPLDTVLHALKLCGAASVPVVLDPAPAAPLPDLAWTQIDWFTPNETEAALYSGENCSAEEAAARLLARGLQGVILKRGETGSYIATRDGRAEWVPAFAVNAVDTVAAGDCFNGAFAVALLEGLDPRAAARFASAAAAISVTRHGAQVSMPLRTEVDDFLKRRG
ncbi:MAG TPA: ribokinase [Terracidiphilus sp.]|nr:ribokinase [Terracidiphilus sp.]